MKALAPNLGRHPHLQNYVFFSLLFVIGTLFAIFFLLSQKYVVMKRLIVLFFSLMIHHFSFALQNAVSADNNVSELSPVKALPRMPLNTLGQIIRKSSHLYATNVMRKYCYELTYINEEKVSSKRKKKNKHELEYFYSNSATYDPKMKQWLSDTPDFTYFIMVHDMLKDSIVYCQMKFNSWLEYESYSKTLLSTGYKISSLPIEDKQLKRVLYSNPKFKLVYVFTIYSDRTCIAECFAEE